MAWRTWWDLSCTCLTATALKAGSFLSGTCQAKPWGTISMRGQSRAEVGGDCADSMSMSQLAQMLDRICKSKCCFFLMMY